MSRVRRTAALVLLAVGAAAVLAIVLTRGSAPARSAADLSQFRAGSIISDQLFFDGNAMSAAQVQSFLEEQEPGCSSYTYGGVTTPCMKSYRVDTYSRPSSNECRGSYSAAVGETAATIIAKVGQACGISQRVLLVLLQKEQGLVTASGAGLWSLSASPPHPKYDRATGYGCPDHTGGTCNSSYYGFYNQVYMAAWQFRHYALNPGVGTAVGVLNTIAYSPTSSCGSSRVLIANQATAGLYRYTPYQPDAGALNGHPDSCSSYGNRNFWMYFTDWFGSTQSEGGWQIVSKWNALGGSGSFLGASTGDVACTLRNGGCWQPFQGGSIYWSPASGAHVIRGDIYTAWAGYGYETGLLGYPTSDVTDLAAGSYGVFQGGAIYFSPATGAHFVKGAIYTAWAQQGYEGGPLGFPTRDETNVSGGTFSLFQHGAIYWSPASGAHSVAGDVYTAWAGYGYESSWLGFPTTDVATFSRGTYGVFQGGGIYATPSSGSFALHNGPVYAAWAKQGYENGPLGLPTSDQATLTGGVEQEFAGGSIYSSPAGGAHLLTGATRTAWLTTGGTTGVLGFPTSDLRNTADGTYQLFAGGALYASAASGQHLVRGDVYGAWARQGYERGALGYPTTDVTAVSGGLRGDFQGGSILSSPSTGAHVMNAVLTAGYDARGGPAGSLGFPTTDQVTTATGGAVVHFTGGSLYWSSATGVHSVAGPTYTAWAALNYENGVLGYPTQDATDVAGGTVTTFEHGSVYWSAGTGAHAVYGVLGQAYDRLGGAAGALGLPGTDQVKSSAGGGGLLQHFQGGSIYWSAGTGAHLLRGDIYAKWAATGFENGALGYPTTDENTLSGGAFNVFQGGAIYWSQAGGAHVVRGAFYDAWARSGYEGGPLGYPTSDEQAVTGGRRMTFQGGSILVTSSGQAVVTTG